jgi:5-methyltetrahydrofolate--homocysteine methyltransferase
VKDASRVVDVVASLLDEKKKAELDKANRARQEDLRELYRQKIEQPLIPYARAVERRRQIDWESSPIATPAFVGGRMVDDVSLAELTNFIDWTFFFAAWEIRGGYPKVLDHPEQGAAARELFADGQDLLRRIIDERSLVARGVYGFWPANSDGDDVVLWTGPDRSSELLRFNMLRQQRTSDDSKPTLCLADFVAPIESGRPDHLGAFAVTAGVGAEELAHRFEADHDDYQSIMVKALADRLAEAFAEMLHKRVRSEWGFADDPATNNVDLIREGFRGIRPAFGYPACPDHSEKRKLFELLGAGAAGIELTENCAMTPAASVSGIYFAHPESRYFTVGRVDRDQIESYARRKGVPFSEAERWLHPNLAYDPD